VIQAGVDHIRNMRYVLRNCAEFLVLFAFWFVISELIARKSLDTSWLVLVILFSAWGKCLFFGIENLQELWQATLQNLPYYKFMLLMLINMSQIITSFALDYHCLLKLNPDSFGGIPQNWSSAELLFECFYFSVLNFTFFGYGDVTPQTIPAKLLTVSEVLLAFITVIFLLSDFISLKESLVRRKDPGSSSKTD
jgi:hypothetical protein